MIRKLIILLVGVVASASINMSVQGQVAVLNNTQAQVVKLSEKQTEKALQDFKKFQECGYSTEQIKTMLQEAVTRAAENSDTEIEIKSEIREEILWFVVGAVMTGLVGSAILGFNALEREQAPIQAVVHSIWDDVGDLGFFPCPERVIDLVARTHQGRVQRFGEQLARAGEAAAIAESRAVYHQAYPDRY